MLLDRVCHGRTGDFGIARSLEDNGGGITFTHGQTEHVMGTQVYMSPEYHHGDKLSTKVDAFAFGLVIIETLTQWICGLLTGTRSPRLAFNVSGMNSTPPTIF